MQVLDPSSRGPALQHRVGPFIDPSASVITVGPIDVERGSRIEVEIVIPVGHQSLMRIQQLSANVASTERATTLDVKSAY